MKPELLIRIMHRLIRKEKSTILWAVRYRHDIRCVIDTLREHDIDYKFNHSREVLTIAGRIKIIFILTESDEYKIADLLIDEVIIDET